MRSQVLVAAAATFVLLATSCARQRVVYVPESTQQTSRVPSVPESKKVNWVLINRLVGPKGEHYNMIGVYAVQAKDRVLRGNPQVNWGENLLSSPIGYGNYFAFNVIHSTSGWYDLRVDFDGTDPEGKPMQYFHKSAHLFNDTIVHQSIESLQDGSSPWKVDNSIDAGFREQ